MKRSGERGGEMGGERSGERGGERSGEMSGERGGERRVSTVDSKGAQSSELNLCHSPARDHFHGAHTGRRKV